MADEEQPPRAGDLHRSLPVRRIQYPGIAVAVRP